MKTLQQTQQIDTGALKKFAQAARRQLREQVAAQLDRVVKSDSAELREKQAAIKELKEQIAISSREAVIERVAYTWFNRFCALRFMDVNRYTRMGTVSPADGFTQPEILAEAKQGHIDESIKAFINKQRVFDLLGGHITSKDPQQEAYRLLIVAVCNYYNSIMPFLFEKIADYTELLMPDDLLSDSSVLADMRDTLTENTCKDVEVIGWLYQFYISEKKDEVFEDLKKNKKITPEDIPAATQLFTPHWIVRYLVENSLGRLWMLNRPKSRLVDRMDYYIKPEKDETDFLRVTKPEELKVCDPACGSGHMLVYAFDLLYSIYEEEGYEPTEIPSLILQQNLYGIEIDERAAELAAFALVMKARQKYRRFFNKPTQPQICLLRNVCFEAQEISKYIDAAGRDLLTVNVQETLMQFEASDNFGSLIVPAAIDVGHFLKLVETKNLVTNIFLSNVHERVLEVLRFADFLHRKYHVVIANPPYMGTKGMNVELKQFLSNNYPEVKSDLFSAFVQRIMSLTLTGGYIGMMTPFNWMFLGSFEKLRNKVLSQTTLTSLVRPEFHAFFDSAYVSICAFTLFTRADESFKGTFIDLQKFYGSELQPVKLLHGIKNVNCGWVYQASAAELKKIKGSPIAYWVNERIREIFSSSQTLNDAGKTRQGLATADNGRFLRYWYEISLSSIGFNLENRDDARHSGKKWFPCNKGGTFRKWYGNNNFVVNWQNDGQELRAFDRAVIRNDSYYFKQGLTWSSLSCSSLSMRFSPPGYISESKGSMYFCSDESISLYVLGFANSLLVNYLLTALSPTLDFHEGPVGSLPLVVKSVPAAIAIVSELIEVTKDDWDASELSWGFTEPQIRHPKFRSDTLRQTYQKLREWQLRTAEQVQQKEEKLNQLFLSTYSLENQFEPKVSLEQITLNSNPYYRFDASKPENELESLHLSETVRELISYAVGTVFGRYSLDKPGIILANLGEEKSHYHSRVPDPSFEPDEDNVVPILDGDWFSDDISERFRKFLRVTFGDEHYQENLQFIETALGNDIRKYFLKDFYTDHVKRYKKRPIYWLFSSPKGTFNALIYMHRYRPDTVSIILNDYLREFRNKLSARKSHLESVTVSASVSPAEKTKALKEIEILKKAIDELDTYERDVLYPLAGEKVQIDLDDGVRVNYNKLGRALKSIPGMTSEED
ncbi:MAG: hypothetical protein QG574_5245 [Cyanobacteriota bacterium erpe_2018_sw_21hr_WHONDRS-SW48-000092_B_bin.40]|nr:hypothetical protein [Cyanobacteriota bacterium erpe_2018_sw_21hr_WHONDRS-SW48-000092_B_bin.40]